MRKFVFITGTGRCGTKLIHGLLDGNPDLNIVPGAVTNLFAGSLSYNGFSNNVYYINSKKTLTNIIAAFKSAKSIHQKSNFCGNNEINLKTYYSNNEYEHTSINP